MPGTTYIGPIRDLLEQGHPQPNPLWNLSADNQLGAGWLWATPINEWGQTYSQFKQAVPGSGPLGLEPCTGTDEPTQLCQAMNASMTAPGQTPRKLLVGHSDLFVDAIYDVMTSAEVLLDVTTLSPPAGRFLDALKNALRYLSNKPDGHRPVVRILFSNPLPNYPKIVTADPFITDITSQLDPAKRMEIYVYVLRSGLGSWNHAKIVAADGVRAIVGGHNQWGSHYLGKNPVFDLSMRLTGTAARHAQDYANEMWVFGQWQQDHLFQWINNPQGPRPTLLAGYLPAGTDAPSQVRGGVLPSPAMYATATGRFCAPPAGGSVPVLAVGRSGGTHAPYYWFPTLANCLSSFTEPSDDALIKLVSLAQHTVRMSIQAFQAGWGPVMGWNPGVLDAMADALNRGVNIDVVLSDPNAVAGGLDKLSAPYPGNKPEDVNAKMIGTMTSRLPLPEQTARQIVSQRLRVATIRYSADASYPDGVPIGNHAKSFIVDDSVFYIGSQNTYRCNLNEFGYIVEDPDAARAYLDTYWTPLWNWSKNTVTTGVDPDLKTVEQVEAMQFIMAIELNTLLHRQWSELLDQHTKAPGAEAKSAIEELMTELIVSAAFDTTSAMVLAGLKQPFFTETPPSAEPTAEALRFVANLMYSTELMAAFDAAVMTSAGTVDAYNAAISTFLRNQGYTCTVLEVLAAFKAMRDKTLAYWTGSYTTWLIDDGGVCYPNSSITPRTAAGTTLDSTGPVPEPVPELGPLLVVTPEGVTLDGAEVADLIYNDNELTWSGPGDAGSASLQFGTVTRATPTDSFTGAECFGTITYPDAGDGARHGTYSLYARVSGSSGEPGSTDGKSYTLAYILAALGAVGLLAVTGLYRFVNARRQADLARAARDTGFGAEPEEEGASRPPFSEVTSWRRVTESGVINRINTREQAARERLALEDAARYESGMSLADRGRLASDMRRVQATEEALENPTAQALPDVVQTANAQLNSVATSMRELFGSIGSKLSAQARTQLAESSQAADDLGKVYDDIMEQREKGEPFEFEIEDL